MVVHLFGAFGSAPASRARDPGSNPDPGENFSFKLIFICQCLIDLNKRDFRRIPSSMLQLVDSLETVI